MKQFIFTVILFISFFGQSQIKEGHITYSITTTTDNPEMQMVIGMMTGSKMEIYFMKDKTRTDMNMGTMMSVTAISNLHTDEVLTLMSGMGMQTAMKSTVSEMKEANDTTKSQVTLIDETKEIMGIKCKKAILTDGDGTESVFWYTNEIEMNKSGQSYLNTQVPGFPMAFELNNNGMKMSMLVTNFEKKLSKKSKKSQFEMTIPEGYELKTKEDLMNMGQ